MSAWSAVAGTVGGWTRPVPPRLTLVPPMVRRLPRTPFVALVTLLLAAGLVALLLLNTAMQRGSFVVHDLQRETTALQDRQELLAQEVARLQAPGRLALLAQEQGMVPNPAPVFLSLADGTVRGVPTPAAG